LVIEGEYAPATEPDDEIVGEFDDDPPDAEIEDDPPRIQEQRDREPESVIDVEIVDAGYTEAPMSRSPGTAATPDADDSSRFVDLGATPCPCPLGPTGPVGSRLMRLEDAVQAQADMEARAAARLRDMRRR